MPSIYLPEYADLASLVAAFGPRGANEHQRRVHQELLESGYLAMQVFCERTEANRLLSSAAAREFVKGRAWAIQALCAPLPTRPPLLHIGCDPCPVEGCLDSCLGDECVCTVPERDQGFRICMPH